MKAIIEFNLDDADDRQAHLRCIKALDMSIAIWNVVHNNKHLNDAEIVEKMYSEFEELNIDDLIE